VVEGAADIGIGAGWGPYLRDVTVSGNLVRDCAMGVAASAVRDAGHAVITGNTISGAVRGAIVGMDHRTPVTGDLSLAGSDVPGNLTVSNNVTT